MARARNALVQRTAAQVASIPAPIGGWNARDSLANMEVTDAVQLTNMFPTVSSVNLRGGYRPHATGITGQVESLFNYSGGNTEKLFAVAGGKIYNVTASGAVGAAVVSGLSNSRWEYVNVSTTGGSYLYAANGVDAPLLYDGTNWTAITAVSTPAITGVTTTTLDDVTLFKNRLWFIQKNTLKAWYLPTSSVGGAAEQLDLSSICRFGGYLVSVGTWTIDAGYGADDNLVFVTSNGEIVAYRGTDPASASTWTLIGVWKLGTPIGKRCMFKYSGDLLILTLDGLYPLASAVQSSRLDPRIALSDKIQGAFAEATRTYQDNFGWQIIYNAKNNALFVNVPVAEGSQQQQYVMNNITKSWCNFTNWNANCWEIFNDDPYFGGDGFVAKAWTTDYQDDEANIQTLTLQAFNYYGSRGVKKYFTRARPSIFTNGTATIFVGMNIDFQVGDTTAAISAAPVAVGVWGTAKWDQANWGDDLAINNSWQGITGIGYCGAIQFKSASSGLQIEWAATDVVYQTGWAGI
jgi:hypothetical protein